MTILNLTQHKATPEQQAAGVLDLPMDCIPRLRELLTFEELPDYAVLRDRADEVADLIELWVIKDTEFMVGGAPYFVPVLCSVLQGRYSRPCLHAFTQRVSVEDPATGVKTSVFKHAGFVRHYVD